MKILLLLLAHLLGDYIFQNTKLAKGKITDRNLLYKHCLIYSICIVLVVSLYGNLQQIIALSLIPSITHFLIDIFKIDFLTKQCNQTKEKEYILYILDQLVHLTILFIISRNLPDRNIIGDFFSCLFYNNVPKIKLFDCLLIFITYVICLNPIGIFVKKTFLYLGFQEAENEDDNRSGYVIGLLERVCILTLAIQGQFTAISFVIAAKSLARKASLEDPVFAEKYLIGTLISLSASLILGITVRYFLKI